MGTQNPNIQPNETPASDARAAMGRISDALNLYAHVEVAMAERWWAAHSGFDGPLEFVGSPRLHYREFDREALESFSTWLEGATWLEAFQDLTVEDLIERLIEMLSTFGAVSLPAQRKPPRLRLGPLGAIIGPAGREIARHQVLLNFGIRPLSPEATALALLGGARQLSDEELVLPDSGAPLYIRVVDLLYDLICLRDALLLGFDVSSGRWDQARERLNRLFPAENFAATIAGLQKDEHVYDDEIPDLLARLWISAHLGRGELRATVKPELRGPGRIVLTGATALQQVWLGIAVTVGAIDPPVPIDGIYRCAYQACRRTFTGRRRPAGTLPFCSKRHGKSYWAAKATRERRQREKEHNHKEEPGDGRDS